MACAPNLCREKVPSTILPVSLRDNRSHYETIRRNNVLWHKIHLVYILYTLSFHSVCAFVNVLSLIFSVPFVVCDNERKDDYIGGSGGGQENDSGRCDKLFVWFVVITCIDFVVSVVYTLQLIARVECAIYLRVHKDRVSVAPL